MKDEDELEPDGNVEMVQQGARCSLTILSSEGEDSGTYTCLAFNTSGHVCCQAQLVVEEGETTRVTVLQYYSEYSVVNQYSCLRRPTGVPGEGGGAWQEEEVVHCLRYS